MVDKIAAENNPFDFAVRTFSESWCDAALAYDEGRINSERCLQSFLYHGLMKRFADKKDYTIFIESRINLTKTSAINPKKRRYIDTVIAYQAPNSEQKKSKKQVVLAIEIKYTSRGKPRIDSIKKDFASLSYMLDSKTTVDIERILGGKDELIVTSKTRIAFGVFFAAFSDFDVNKKIFDRYKPDEKHQPTERWSRLIEGNWRERTLPANLYIFGAQTYDKSNGSDGAETKITMICNASKDAKFIQYDVPTPASEIACK